MSSYSTRQLFAFLLFILPFVALSGQIRPQAGCDSVVLSARSAGVSYSWSTGDTTRQTTVFQSDTVWVDIALTNGTVRDSFSATVFQRPPAPMLGDTSVCQSADLVLDLSGTPGTTFWYTQIDSTPVFVGDSLRLRVDDTTFFYARRISAFPPSEVGKQTLGTAGISGFFNGQRGLVFDAFEDFFLSQVTLHANAAATASVLLLDGQGRVLDSLGISLPVAGANRVALDFFVPRGSGYTLTLKDLQGGRLYLETPAPFPFANPTVSIRGGTPVGSQYAYFYDWKINLTQTCGSAYDSLRVSTRPVPDVELGEDTLLCGGNLTLDASFAGSSYQWSTGDTTATVTLSQTDTVEVAVDLDGCVVTDDIFALILPDPSVPSVEDTVVCQSTDLLLEVGMGTGTASWYNQLGGSVIFRGDSFQTKVLDTTQLYVRRIVGFERGQVGKVVRSTQGVSGFFTGQRGLVFDASEAFYLSEVTIYANDSSTATVLLLDAQGKRLDSLDIVIPDSGQNNITLDFYVPSGTDYLLTLKNLQNGRLYLETPSPFPFTSPQVQIKGGNPVANQYAYFYDWQINVGRVCASPYDSLEIGVRAAPEIELGPDTTVCGASLTLDASFPGATYAWTTGDTTASVTINQAGIVGVVVDLAGCQTRDSLFAAVYAQPSAPVVTDQSLCSPGTATVFLANADTTQTNLWFDLGQTQILGRGDSLSLNLADTTRILARRFNGLIPTRLGKDVLGTLGPSGYYAVSDRGLVFDAHQDFFLSQVTLPVDGPATVAIALRDSAGRDVDTARFSLPQAGMQVVDLDFFVPKGNDYYLVLTDIQGGRIYLEILAPYPFVSEYATIKTGRPFANQYCFFYDWNLNAGKFCASTPDTVQLDVAIPVDLPDTIFSCDPVALGRPLPATQVSWNTGAMTDVLIVEESGRYILTALHNNGCLLTDTVGVGIPRPAGLPEDGTLCGMTLRSDYAAPDTVIWSTGDTTAALPISQAGTYSVEIRTVTGCVRRDTIDVTGFAVIPTVALGSDTLACDSIVLNAQNPGATYLWSTGDTTQEIVNRNTGLVFVAVTNSAGCTGRDSISVNIDRAPTANFITTVVGFSLNLTNLSSISSASSFLWNFGDGTTSQLINPAHTYTDTGTYVVQLVVSGRCGSDTARDTVQVVNPQHNEAALIDDVELSMLRADGRLLAVTVKPSVEDFVLALYDLKGRKLRSWTLAAGRELIALEELPAGLYVFRISSRDRRMSYKLIVR